MIKGQELRLLINTGSGTYTVVGLAKDLTWNNNAVSEDVTTKDTPDGVTEKYGLGNEKSFTCNSLVASVADAKTWNDAVGTIVEFSIGKVTGNKHDTSATGTDNVLESGHAFIDSVSIQSTNRQFVTLAINASVVYQEDI